MDSDEGRVVAALQMHYNINGDYDNKVNYAIGANYESSFNKM